MAVHWVNYDLTQPGQNYDDLIEYLKSHPSWAKPLESSFFIDTPVSAAKLRDEITKRIDSSDKVVVVTVTNQNWATKGISSKVTDWMKKHL